jgi:hypothetical protein
MEWPEMLVRNLFAVTRAIDDYHPPTLVDHDQLGVCCGHDLDTRHSGHTSRK